MTATDEAIRARYEGDFIESAELMAYPAGVKVTIESVMPPKTKKDKRGKQIQELILVLKGATTQREMIVGKTNFRVLESMYGKQTDKWVGKEITLGVRYLPKEQGFGQHNCPCVRVIPPHGTPIPKSAWNFMGSANPLPEKTTRVDG